MKLFLNLNCGFSEEDLLRICSCLYSENSPHLLIPCLLTDQNFGNNFWERPLKEYFCEIFQNLTSGFAEDSLRIFSWPYSAKSPHTPEPCSLMAQNFAYNFYKGSPKEHSSEILTSGFSIEDFLRITSYLYSTKSHHSPEPCLWTNQNFANNFWKGHPRNIP